MHPLQLSDALYLAPTRGRLRGRAPPGCTPRMHARLAPGESGHLRVRWRGVLIRALWRLFDRRQPNDRDLPVSLLFVSAVVCELGHNPPPRSGAKGAPSKFGIDTHL